MELPQETVDQIREQHATSKEEAQRLKAEADQAAQTEKMWSDLHHYVVEDWPFHICSLMEKESSRFRKMKGDNHPAIPAVENIHRIAKDESDRMLRRYPSLLEEECRSNGLILDSNSPHPRYGLESGFFRLEIDEQKRMARLFDHEGRLAEVPADVKAVVGMIQREHQRVFGRSFDGPKFLKTLRAQYKAVIKKDKRSDGSSVPIRHITRRLGKNIKGFRTDEFLVDLSRLAEKGPFEIDGRRLDLQQTKDTNQGMLLQGAAARGYIGFVVFREV